MHLLSKNNTCGELYYFKVRFKTCKTKSVIIDVRSPSEAMLTSGGDLHSGDKLLFR